MASPHVAGIMAVILSMKKTDVDHKNLTPTVMKKRLLE